MTGNDHWVRAALAGVAAVSGGLGAAELIAALAIPGASPLLAVGSFVIDLVPPWVKDLAISLFGTADKIALLLILGVLLALLAAAAGLVEQRKPPLGRWLAVMVGLIGVLAAATRANSGVLTVLPSIVAAAVAVIALGFLMRQLREQPAEGAADGSRRRFLIVAGTTTALGILATVGGRILSAGTQTLEAARSLFTLPTPAVSAPPIPAEASLDVPGVVPLITPNANFYRIDTALLVPRVEPKDWNLRITGMVENDVTLSFDELIALPLEESTTTLACVSNYVGGDLIGTATWLGYPIRHLLARAGPSPDADMVLSRSIDGFTASTPLTALTDDRNAILAVGMNGEPLPLEHGYPVRMVVPGLYGYVSATKWVTELRVTRFAREVAYWTQRGWSERGPIKLSSRIDVPRQSQTLGAGTVVVAGVAWSPHVGISSVQVRIDDGPFNDAELAEAISIDTWRQWAFAWRATPGEHRLSVRAVDAAGKVQVSRQADVVPDGATGLHSIGVTIS
ncbi:molybdopterin-dependent oxidoreductase [Homoserinimonas sp. A520]